MNFVVPWTLLGSEGDWALYIPMEGDILPHRATLVVSERRASITLFDQDGEEVGKRTLVVGERHGKAMELLAKAHLFNTLVLVTVERDDKRHVCECVVVDVRNKEGAWE